MTIENLKALDLENGIAVIGMHCLFPGANSASQFWERLCEGYEAVEDLSDEALVARGVSKQLLNQPAYVKAGIPLAGIDEFDYSFFGISPKEAAIMDPQHRKFLECSWAALEDSGHRPTDVAGAIGMFAGSGMPWYLIRNVLTHTKMVDELGEFLVRHTANDKDFLATRASFSMNIHGPSINVQTACSTSLVAVHLAMQSLLSGECDIVIAGGSTIEIPNSVGYLFREEEVRSADGRCRAFDKDSDGTVFGSGVGAVVLRRLEDALADGDSVQAVLLGSAVNNDGSEKAGYMAPSVDYQAQAIAEAMAVADVSPDSVGYFETHGTGTKIGDPIEVAALTQAFGETKQKQFCGLGSVKTNIGHLDTAAGIASLIKVVSCLKHNILPASLHYKKANPEIDFESSPFYVNRSKKDWPLEMTPRIAGVSSLGVGGTNAHIIACEPPTPESSLPPNGQYVLPLSAKTATSLRQSIQNLHQHLERTPNTNIADVAFTLQEGRVEFQHRAAVVCRDVPDALRCLGEEDLNTATATPLEPDLVFMFSGQGSQYPGMAAGLYEEYAGFRDIVDECLTILRKIGGPDLKKALFAHRGDKEIAEWLEDTSIAQPALFIIEYALAQLLISWRIRPSSMIGHSLGEYVAATIAGVFTLEEALDLVTLRGKLIGQLPSGSMIAVPSSVSSLAPYLNAETEIAAINSQDLTVISGTHDAINDLLSVLDDAGIGGQLLKTSHAFHSAMLEPVLDEFTAAVAKLNLEPPSTPFVSNVSGTWITDEQAQSADYWARHMRQTVNFLGGIQSITEKGNSLFLEVGPGHTLTNLAPMSFHDSTISYAFSCLPHAKHETSDSSSLLSASANLWAHGFKLDWNFNRTTARRQRLQLPTYSFDKHRCWLDPNETTTDVAPSPERLDISQWGYVANWRQQLPPGIKNSTPCDHVLVFAKDDGPGNRLVSEFGEFAELCTVIRPGKKLGNLGDNVYYINPESSAQHTELLESFGKNPPTTIIHAWNMDDHDPESLTNSLSPAIDAELLIGFFSLMNLAKGIQATDIDVNFRILVVASDVFSVRGETTQPVRATLLGPVRVIPSEFPEIQVQLLDFHSADVASDPGAVAARIMNEVRAHSNDREIVYRGVSRYCQVFDAVTIPEASADQVALKHDGVYLITGGFGGLGRSLAERLARDYQARIVILGRSRTIRGRSPADENGRKQFVQFLEELGSEVHRIEVDIVDPQELSDALGLVKQRFGSIDGVFHMAGRLDDALISIKDNEAAKNVLMPKLRGTLALEQALGEQTPTFHIYFSSISGLAGLPGQIDYAAANTFIDAFAQERNRLDTCKHISIGWSSWADNGMASRASTEARLLRSQKDGLTTISHSIFSHIRQRDDGVDFFGEISATRLWYLNEHRLRSGHALLPGTAYIELIVSAYSAWQGAKPVQLENLVFAVPLQLDDGESKILHLEYVVAANGDCEVIVSSWSQLGEDPLEHVRAKVTAMTDSERPDASEGRKLRVTDREAPGSISNPLLDFGERWSCLDKKSVVNDKAIIDLRLTDEFGPDLLNVPLHPAMMDIAIGGAPELFIEAKDKSTGIVPFMVRSIKIWAPLEPQVTSYIHRTSPENDDSPESDIRIESNSGDILIEVRGFCMRKLDAKQLDKMPAPELSAVRHNDSVIVEGISAAEGFELVTRLLATDSPSHILIAPQDLNILLRELRRQFDADESQESGDESTVTLLPRPVLNTNYIAADSAEEQIIAQVWQNALGIADIGVEDNFFELGGHSLLLTQIVSRIRREHNWALPLEKVFDQLTIAEWAKLASVSKPNQSETMQKIKRVNRNTLRTDSTLLKRLQ